MAGIIKQDDLAGQMKVREVTGSRKGHYLPGRGVIAPEVLKAAEQAEAILQDARESADVLLRQAQAMEAQMATQVEDERKQGYEKGHQEGLAEVTEKLTEAATYRERMLQEAEPELIRMVFQIAEKILGEAIEKGAVIEVVKQALKEAVGERITVRVNPEDLERVRASEKELMERLASIKSLTVVADENVEAGGCAVDTEVGTIDAQLSTQLLAIKKSLGLTD